MNFLRKTTIIFFFLLILSSFFVFGAPPGQEEGLLNIAFPKTGVANVNENFTFHVHTYDSNGVLLNNSEVDCFIHIYGIYGNHEVQSVMSKDSNWVDHEYEFDPMISGDLGQHSYIISCEQQGVSGESGFISEPFYISSSGLAEDMNSGGKWISIVLSLFFMTGIMLFITTQIKDKLLKPVKIVFFVVSVINGLLLGVLAYIISLNPYDVTSYRTLGLAYASINIFLIMGFIFNYSFVLFARIYKRSKDRWVNSFKGGVNK